MQGFRSGEIHEFPKTFVVAITRMRGTLHRRQYSVGISGDPSGNVMSHGDENKEWVDFPQPGAMLAFWRAMPVIDTCLTGDPKWRKLFTG